MAFDKLNSFLHGKLVFFLNERKQAFFYVFGIPYKEGKLNEIIPMGRVIGQMAPIGIYYY